MVEALIVVDVQRAFVYGSAAVPASPALLGAVNTLLDAARAAGALVVHLQNDGAPGADDEPGTDGWQLHLTPDAGEIVVRKTGDDGFEGTALEAILRDRAVHSVALCGLLSEMCVAATARDALARGYRVVLPHDAHATYDIPADPDLPADFVPAAVVARVAEWSLGDQIEIPRCAADVTFG